MSLEKITEQQMNEKGVCAAPDILNGTPAENKNIFDRMVRQVVAPAYNACVDAVETINAQQKQWGEAEAGRVTAENGRVTAEEGRVTAENQREQNESARKTAETERKSSEQTRNSQETTRQTAEQARKDAEAARVTAENQRALNETNRQTAEETRSQTETLRKSAEADRANAESGRVQAETERSVSETKRAEAETGRVNAENGRKSAEEARVLAENNREAQEIGYVAQARAEADRAAEEANAAQRAETGAKNAETGAKNAETGAKSWTAGGTGSRDGEDTDNAQYYAGQAKISKEAAAASAAQAQANADAIDPNQINARIDAKGDNLEFDEEQGLLYLTSGGERIGDGIKVITSGGGGGGGGEANNAVLTLTNTTGWIYKSIAYGASCPLSINWSSLENDLETGSGVLQVIVAGSMKHTVQVEQGDVTIDVAQWLPVGSASVKLKITDVYGNARSLNFNITTVQLTLESSFDATVAYSGAITYPYTPTGTAAKIVHFKLDGTELDPATVTASGRQQTMTIQAQSHGSHTFEVWFTATVDGETVESNHLYYDIICIEEGNTTPIIATSFRQTTAEQFDSIAIPYIVYDPAGLTAAVVLAVDGAQVASLTVDRTEHVWTYRADDAGDLSLSITCGNAIKIINLTVTESTINVSAETDSLALHLSSYGRNNNEENPGVWQSGSVAATMTGFNWTSDGWKADADGITALRVAGDARVTIPLNIFANDFRTTGKTIEVEFATRDVLDYDAVVISCWSGDRGLKITAQKALMKSEQSEISTQYKEDEHVRLSFVVQKRSEYRLLMVYINGILSGAAQYPVDDDFSQSAPVGISIGSNSCTTDIYCIRVYDNDLTRFQVLDNWIADTQVGLAKKERYDRNKVFDDYSQIVIDQLPQDLPYLILEAAELPQYKGDKKTVSGRYVDPVTPGNSFTFTGAQADVQGTSSQYYARKNYKIKFNGGFTQNGATSPKYQLRSDSVPTDTFTFKADVASSEGANNVELVRLYNEACPYRTPPQKADSTVRQGIDGFPIVVFQDDGSGPKFIGKYNFNNDKGTPEVFGFAEGDESWEILNNTSDRVLWKSDDFSGTDWQNDFEARYPEDSTDTTDLASLASWLKSTDQSAVDTAEEKAARLAKFKAELSDHLDVDSTLFYYLFTELFLMVDSRAKNAFPSMLGGDKWCWLPYDMDTAIGTNNEGQLVFGYALEDTDKIGTADVFNGQNSVLWVNLRQAFHDELMAMYQTLRSQGKLSYADTEARFEVHQAKWPEAIFNEDSFFKYLEPLMTDGSGAYLAMLQGSKAEQRKWWLYNRFRYLDSKYNAGDSLSDVITVRGYAKSNITVTPYADIYTSVKYGSYLVQTRALRGSSYELECPLDNVNDTEIYVYSASQIKDVGDLSGLKVGYAEFSMATKLQSLKLGDSADSYSNPNLTELYLGNNVLMKTIDVRNCPNLTQAVDLSGCTGLETVYFDGTAITGCTLPNGGILKVLHLPETITNLTIRNQTGITDFTLPGYGNITTLRLENVSGAVPAADILAAIPANSRVRLIGFDWSFDAAADILSLYDRLDTMRGLDEQGNNVDKAQLSGTVRVDSITGAQLTEMQSRYPSINVVYQHITSNLYFYNGDTLLATVSVANGGDGTYTGSTPTKASTAQYTYTFAGWSKTNGGSADSNALKNVTADRNVYAVFTATVRTYTVIWKNGSTTLETDTNVPYGTTPTYNGSTPEYTGSGDASEYTFNGWTPAVGPITGDTTYTAQFKYSGYYYVKLIDRSISGAYTNETVTSIGGSAFCGCSSLTTVVFPATTSIGKYAFDDCGKLITADFPAVTSIDKYAFNCCLKLTTLILRSDTMSTLSNINAFSSTPIESGTGYIYVPAALVDSYKAATNWSTFANQFRSIEDYPEITGGTA
ncbi:leucine-rich repeat protein [Oscillibacter sp.]|uniref:leucine-rich repeat protein n=1 Tax=Oscillibacter sp. TaxID=1945593 RepID=UPI001B690605|nr:leucine-rich repeat protein [Oscillibacter sp.]MBP3510305.1 leucine-rich repeat protein [Oscillibacter sp.]